MITHYDFITEDEKVSTLKTLAPLIFNKFYMLVWSKEPYIIWEVNRAGHEEPTMELCADKLDPPPIFPLLNSGESLIYSNHLDVHKS